jgi:predicted nuclease with TOPRIM domain
MDWTSIAVALIGLAGSAGLWSWFRMKAELSAETKKNEKAERVAFRENLEDQVETLHDENKDLREKVERLLIEMAEVKAQLAEAHATIRYLEDKLINR